MKTSPALTAAALVLMAAALTSCGSDDPAVCGSANDLKASIEDLPPADITSADAVADLKAALQDVKSDVDTVKADAEAEFSTQLGAVDSAYTALSTAVDGAQADPSPATLTAAGAALSTFVTDAKALVSAVESTC